jgi:Flp pilus assembly pilin Flp
MIQRLIKLRDERGVAAIEFAFALPAFIVALVGVVQLGTVFFADAGLRTAVGAGARLAAVFPTPTPEAVKAAMMETEFRTAGVTVKQEADVAPCTQNGFPCYDISMKFKVPINLIFFNPGDITLTETRRVFLQQGDLPEIEVPDTESSASTTTSSGSTSAGGSPDVEDPVGPGDGGSTTTSGGTTTTTTSGGTTTTTTSSSTSSTSSGNNASSGNASSGNASSGNGNGSSGNGNGSSGKGK